MTYIWSNSLGDGYVDMDIDFLKRSREIHTEE